ncbi:MAG: serine/threonine-protein phosphatase [Planctomycetes bacterium]|nr:serine/threonine-protein phosphatase [Planctomycetota bacterium]
MVCAAPRLLVIRESHQIAEGLARLLERKELQANVSMSCQDGLQRLADLSPSIVIVDSSTSTPPGGPAAFERLLDVLHNQGIACLVLGKEGAFAQTPIPEWVQTLDYTVSADELHGRVASIQHYQHIVRQTQLEMHHMQRLGRHLSKQFAEVDQDMRLASRLQQEFLPQALPHIDGFRFSVVYRPASWVSGDIYDIARVDEKHVSFYVADAMGHGLAASLLTMFVRRAMRNKEVSRSGYRILSPSETLQILNDTLADEQLNNCQYVTAGYCLLDHTTRMLTFARGGHPHLILAEPDGSLREIQTEGGLLGLFPRQEFPAKRIQLHSGQKVILHSDGMELAFVEQRDYETGEPRYKKEFQKVIHLPAEKLARRLEQMIDAEEGSISPQDDVTVVVMEVL